jgi:hypothetical protein
MGFAFGHAAPPRFRQIIIGSFSWLEQLQSCCSPFGGRAVQPSPSGEGERSELAGLRTLKTCGFSPGAKNIADYTNSKTALGPGPGNYIFR